MTTISTIDKHVPTSIIVGNQRVQEYLAHYLKELPLKVEVDPLASKDVDSYVFGRDSRVCLADGSQLIPYPIKDVELEGRFKAMLPASGSHFISSPRMGFGDGFSASNTENAISYAREKGLKYQQAKTCIEGGNCRIFSGADGKPKAIVGINSVILSLIALEEQDYFSSVRKEDEKKHAGPSKEALRIARNLSLFENRLKNQEKGKVADYREKLLAPITDLDALDYHKLALDLEAKLAITRALMAKELGIEEDRVAFVDQYHFHIDMEIFAGEDDNVFLHRESNARAVLENVGGGSKRFRETCAKYKKACESRAKAFDSCVESNAKLIEKIGCKAAFVPGIYEADTVDPINFMNGLLISDTLYATNASEARDFQTSFEETVKKVDSKMKTLFIDDPDHPGKMQEILFNTRGGLHCLTWTH